MKPVKLSNRLLTVASFVEKDAIVADIGSDHAYLPSFLIEKGIIQKAIAGEIARGPFESARGNVIKQRIMEQITVRLADGLAAIDENDGVDTVTISGMGGSLIAKILNNGVDNLRGVKRIIAQPNIYAIGIREWATANGWKLVDEKNLKEDGKIYEVLVLEKGNVIYDELELLVGPFLLTQKNDVFREKWHNEIFQWEQVLTSITHASKTTETLNKIDQLRRYIHIVGKGLEK